MATKSFKGASVFMSRNLVPPELFDSLHDALKQNGAAVFLCCDPSRNAPNDYHIISSPDHEKFKDLRAKGCNLLGPQCVLSCAKEHRALPKEGFTCCLAMDGVKILASGFEMNEKVKIQKLVNSMGGILQTKASSDVSFVIVKNVLAAKYKWAFNILKKPIVTISWLYQCWMEHRVVPQESYRVLPFSGLTICVTRFPADERKEMEKIIAHNGGKYSAELTRNCTHLISDVPEGDKYKVARRWGLHIVTQKWFNQSVSRRACLNEESYPVQGGSISSINSVSCLALKQNQDKGLGNVQSAPSSMAADSNLQAVALTGITDPDLEPTVSENIFSTNLDVPNFNKEEDSGVPTIPPNAEMNYDGCVADDSQTEDNDLYLSNCRILLVGFEGAEMRKLVNMVRRGGGSRYMSSNEKLTHIVVGNPSELERQEARTLAALGVIHVVRSIWLEDCERERKEIPILQRHIVFDLLLPKDVVCSNKGSAMAILREGKGSVVQSSIPADQSPGCSNSVLGISVENNHERKVEINMRRGTLVEASTRSAQQSPISSVDDKFRGQHIIPADSSILNFQNGNTSTVFNRKLFRFSNSFPEDRRAEVVEWINQGGGEVVDDLIKQKVDFTVECHGVVPRSPDVSTSHVSSHWIRSCLEDGCLLDVGSHILYSPLPCQIPFPGFGSFRFCVSQHEEKEKLLLRNLCFVLGAKYGEKLTRKVTHLLCKFASGPKYEAACKWGIKSVTSEWIYECVKQNEVVAVSSFCPKEVTTQDREAGFCTISQYPTEAAQFVSRDDPSQLPSQPRNLRNTENIVIGTRFDSFDDIAAQTSPHCKRARHMKDACQTDLFGPGGHQNNPVCGLNSFENPSSEDGSKVSLFSDVAAAIEGLLEETSKIQDLKLPENTGCRRNLSSADGSILDKRVDPHSTFVLSKHWLSRTEKKVDVCNTSGDVNARGYEGFSETQTESQVVGYEEDLSGRQMIIDRVRAQGSMT